MKIYRVGGAVRDKLLGKPSVDVDYVVVGATPQAMLEAGYRPVGKDFPVFLHPQSNEEYALARTERKTAPGYHGFAFNADPTVTLEQDLERRDLTINAMAEQADGSLVDPFGGKRDLDARVLRHVSPAFAEDPVRILRVARFHARYAALGFRVADETMQLMRDMVAAGEVDHLVAERVWAETRKALAEPTPSAFLRCLRDCGALARLLPELEALFGVPQTETYHPEIDTGVHTLMALQQAALLTPATDVRFALLLHDLGKGTTPRAEWPRHIAHEHRGLKLVERVCQRLKAPGQHRELALKVCEYHTLCHRALALRGKTLLKLLNATDALRRPERFEAFLLACEADARGRKGLEQRDYPQADFLRRAQATAQEVTAAAFSEQGLQGKALGEAIAAERVRRLDALRRTL